MRDVSYVTLLGIISALLGLLADVLLVRLLDVGSQTDTIFAASTLPLLIQSLMIAAYQPALVVHLTHYPSAQFQVGQKIRILAFALTAIVFVAAPLMTILIAPGLDNFWLGVVINAGMSLTIFPLMLGEHARAILHVERRFTTAAGLLLLANLVAVMSILGVMWFGIWGFVLSRYCRALVLWGGGQWLLRKLPKTSTESSLTGKLLQNIFAAGVGYGSLQIPVLVIRGAASLSGEGLLTAIDVAWRLLSQITYLVVLVPITIKLPGLAQISDTQEIQRLLKITLVLGVLSAIGLMVFALPMGMVLYGVENALLLAYILLVMSPSVVGMSLVRFVQYIYFSSHETRKVNILALWITLFSVTLAWAGTAGIGLALNLAALVGLWGLKPELDKSHQHSETERISPHEK